jgi:hypothetical protein
MKKYIAAAVITGLIGTAALADSNSVASANVLGYTKIIDPASNKYVLISAPFNCGTGTVSTLLDIFGTNQLRRNNSFVARCDQVMLWNTVQQRYVAYVQKATGGFYYYTNFSGAAVNPTITRGQAMWIVSPLGYSPSNITIFVSGNVPNDGSYTNSIVGSSALPFNFIANPYPVEMDINSLINTNDGARGNASFVSKADKIMLWNDAGQKYIELSLKLSATVPAVNNKWLYTTNFGSSVTSPPVIKVKLGQGFWYQTTNAFTWVEKLTYTNAFN